MQEEAQKILGATTQLFFKYGIRSVSMDDIAREMGMSKKTIYQYFSNKEDLVTKVVESHLEYFTSQIQEIVADTSNNAIDVLVKVARANRDYLKQINPAAFYDFSKYYGTCHSQLEDHKMNVVYGILVANIQKGIEEGLYRAEINADLVARFYIAQTSLLIEDQKLFPADKYIKDQIYVEFIRYHIHGIASPKGIKYFNKILKDSKAQQHAS